VNSTRHLRTGALLNKEFPPTLQTFCSIKSQRWRGWSGRMVAICWWWGWLLMCRPDCQTSPYVRFDIWFVRAGRLQI